MAISSAGIGSGLDVAKIVEQTVAAEKIPLKKLEYKAEGIQTQISTYGEIKSLTSKLGDIASKLTRDSAWNGVSISSSNPTLSGTMTGIAATGTYNIKVTDLAQAQTTALGGTGGAGGSALAKDQAMGADGTIKLKMGAVEKDISVSSSDTLTKIATKINEAEMGIQASVVTDVDGKERLMLRSKETGTDKAFTVDLSSAPTVLGQNTTQNAQNAKVELNGLVVESSSNTFANTIPGMSFTVSEVTSTAATLNVKADTEAMKKNIQEFVEAYNALNDLLTQSTKYVEESKTAGVLQGDSATVSLQNSLRMLTQGISGSTGGLTRLADIGIQMQEGGKLSMDTTKLDKALTNIDDLKGLFANKADSLGQGGGIAVNFKNFTDKLLSFDGTLNTKTDSLERTLKSNTAEQDKVNKRAEALETRLYAQYSALDVKMSSLNALNSYVSQMVTTWNNSKS
ncbi:flagellar filament capping protein FliD [Comamonas denitrificans]|uniref:Flagellar hook-associated protein 2 n=1 Tax=Comamonas denitrificans TaxID=117506 RepID=A0A939KEF2_9BURK|nr:flagellar filament capping protein FliD [Comamonas denitrificans]MBO1250354.1 flagellar filament capping protein FliD [Comamonas denitrificans]